MRAIDRIHACGNTSGNTHITRAAYLRPVVYRIEVADTLSAEVIPR